ncbi:DUF4226 domain-containing protein [Mycolicibacterium sp.]|uniref:DUF4226 domain-containing protein n=1 Tax=Mycolicibacterium sp. TaxID=2320850 RepID=UPI0037C9E5D6
MTSRKFDELTHWDGLPFFHTAAGWEPGWKPPGQEWNIGQNDPYWDRVLEKARETYGDPNIHYSTDSIYGDRTLLYGDGTKLPADGSIVYHDSRFMQNFVQNEDGTVTRQDAAGNTLGDPFRPTAYRPADDGNYAPIDQDGRQVAPLAKDLSPVSPHGMYIDTATGLRTPKNSNGDYYVLDPSTGKLSYFNKDGKPITAEQFDKPKADSDTADDTAGGGTGLPTDEQLSGRTAEALKKLHEEMKANYGQLGDAEEKLTEAILNAQATTADGKQKLNDIQKKIVDALNNPDLALDTAAGERAFLTFLRGQLQGISDVLASGTLTDKTQADTIKALGDLYAAQQAGPADDGSPAPGPAQPGPSLSDPALTDPALTDPGLTDPSMLGAVEPMPDPSLSDLGLTGDPMAGMGPDPLADLANALPAAMSGLQGMGGGVGDPLSALGSAAAPLAGLASQLGEQAAKPSEPTPDDKPETDEDKKDESDDEKGKDDKEPDANNDQPQPQTPPPGTPQAATPPGEPAPQPAAAPGPPPPPPTEVKLEDGSTVQARNPQLAAAVRAQIDGASVEDSFRQQGIQLPPAGTPVTRPVNPNDLSAGIVGVFQDHFISALSGAKALKDGQIVSLQDALSAPGFMGWMDPTATAASAAPTGAPPPVPAAAPVPASPLQSTQQPVSAGAPTPGG